MLTPDNEDLSAIEAIGLVGVVASLAAIPIAYRLARRQRQREKLLAYRAQVSQLPLVSARSLEDYQLSVIFQRRGGGEERIRSAYLHFLGFANLGREAIRREDIAPTDPLQVVVRGTRVLDLSIDTVSRQVSNIGLTPDIQFEEASATAAIEFDFLDFHDGALIRVLTASVPEALTLEGTIIEMPSGIQDARELGRKPLMEKLGVALSLLLVVAALALTPVVFRWVTGSWSDAWLLALPLIAILVPVAIIIIVAVTIWPSGGADLPSALVPRIRGLPLPLVEARLQAAAGPFIIEGFDELTAEGGESAATPETDARPREERGA